jgi:hypothetical protein
LTFIITITISCVVGIRTVDDIPGIDWSARGRCIRRTNLTVNMITRRTLNDLARPLFTRPKSSIIRSVAVDTLGTALVRRVNAFTIRQTAVDTGRLQTRATITILIIQAFVTTCPAVIRIIGKIGVVNTIGKRRAATVCKIIITYILTTTFQAHVRMGIKCLLLITLEIAGTAMIGIATVKHQALVLTTDNTKRRIPRT